MLLFNAITRLIMQRLNRLYAVREHVILGRGVHIGLGTVISSFCELTVGDGVYIGKGCTIQVSGHIGRGTLIANHVGIVGRNDHDQSAVGVPMSYAPWVGSSWQPASGDAFVHVGEDVWIGYGAIILSGVSVGRGAVIAAGTVVTKDIPAYAVAVGNPARIVKMRFQPGQIHQHEIAVRDFWNRWENVGS